MSRGEKIAAAKAANKSEREKQSIKFEIGNLTLDRADELNWRITFRGQKDPWYFGSLISALRALPDKLLTKGEMRSLDDILKKVREIEEQINRLYSLKFNGE